ncbi:MAG: YIP1 family protein [Cellulosilyticaceae bacterium]
MGGEKLVRSKRNRSICLVIMALIMFISATGVIYAEEANQSYLYGPNKSFVKAPVAAEPGRDIDHSIIGTEPLKSPSDLYATQNYLYIVDTGNNRILKVDKDYKLVKAYSTYDYNGKEVAFASPKGIYVDPEENMLIADTNNGRLVKMSPEGVVIAIFEAPQSKMLPSNFNYLPAKVVCDVAGRIFVAVDGFNMGLVELDRGGEFVQLLGASKVTYSLTDAVWRFFSTKEQKKRMAAFVPAEYNNITVDEDGFIYATTGTMGQNNDEGLKFVRKLNARGDDVLKRTEYDGVCGDLEWSNTGSIKGPSQIVDCLTLPNGIYAILDQKRGRVFVYDSSGVMLFLFGQLGQTEGTMTSPTSLVMFNDHFLVLDSVKNKVVSFNLTDYGRTILDACYYKEKNDIAHEEAAWQKVYAMNNNHPVIMREMGQIAYRERDMESAMYYFKEGEDQTGYSKAFQFYRREMINQYFTPVALVVIALIILGMIYNAYRKYKRRGQPVVIKKHGPLRYTLYVIFRPLDGFWDLKREKRGSLKVAMGLMIVAGFVLVFQSLATSFIFNDVRMESYNFIFDLLKAYAPLLLWTGSLWCVSTLMDGEGSFKDILMATGYSLTPMLIIVPCATLFSNFLIQDEGILCTFFINVAYIWMSVLLVASVIQTHNYSLKKTLLVIGISLLVIVITLFILLLCLALMQEILAFIVDLQAELVNRL